MSDCPCDIKPQHHAVILSLVHDLTDHREPDCEPGRPLLYGQAWSRHYQAKGHPATVACSRVMTENEDCAASLAWHRKEREALDRPWSDRFRETQRLRASARLSAVTEYGEPDPDGWQKFLRRQFRGVGNRKSTKPTTIVVFEDDDGQVKVKIPAGRSAASLQQLASSAAAAILSLRVMPTAKWGEAEREGLSDWKETKGYGLIPQFDRVPASKMSALTGNLIGIRITNTQAEELAAKLTAERLSAQRAMIEALLAGKSQEWCRGRFAELAEFYRSRGEDARTTAFEALASTATGTALELEKAVVG